MALNLFSVETGQELSTVHPGGKQGRSHGERGREDRICKIIGIRRHASHERDGRSMRKPGRI